MTINLTDVTFDLLVAEQLHDIVPCDDCGKASAWTMVCAGCGYIDFICRPCRVAYEAWIESRGFDTITCADCSTDYPLPLPWVAL